MTEKFNNPLTQKITDFLTSIGIEIIPARLSDDTFLPGILVERGRILVEEEKLGYPGDLLHEAGHLAVAPGQLRSELSGEVVLPGFNMDLVEAQSIAWSYAACVYLHLNPNVIFHDKGYKGKSEALLFNFGVGVYVGLPDLQKAGMAATTNQVRELGWLPYPHMLKWLND